MWEADIWKITTLLFLVAYLPRNTLKNRSVHNPVLLGSLKSGPAQLRSDKFTIPMGGQPPPHSLDPPLSVNAYYREQRMYI
jgi:hypothetical protein